MFKPLFLPAFQAIARSLLLAVGVGTGLALSAVVTAGSAAAGPMHGIAMHGEPRLPADFANFPYANPDAEKGGRITYGVIGSFDSLNPFIVQGAATTARGVWDPIFGNNVFDTLMIRSRDEAFTLYGLVAESIEVPDDRSWVEFVLNPLARFSDGQPITVDDVIFTMEILRDKGRPIYKTWFDKVTSVERVGERGVRFVFRDGSDRELPLLIAGSMPVLPKHAIDVEAFDKSTLVSLIGSGPYVVSGLDAPNQITLTRNPDYWAADLPSKRGLDNYDEMRVDYYRDTTALFEAFKRGLVDVFIDGDPAHWEDSYSVPAVADGSIVKEEFTPGTPRAMIAFAFNTRRPQFADPRVRFALASLFDFEWVNRNLYHGVYRRTGSFWQQSELSSLGVPASEAERALLAAFPDAVAPDVMDGTYLPSITDGTGNDRAALQRAVNLLKEAGYEIREGRMVHATTGLPLGMELLVTAREAERLGLAYSSTLDRVGVTLSIRTVESATYQERVKNFDYDMIYTSWSASLSPGNEQINRWSPVQVDIVGSFNYVGAREPAIDAVIAAMIAARSREDFVTAVRALDRVLISGWYVVPLYHLPSERIAHWRRVERPEITPVFGAYLPSWWVSAATQ